jgi:hypothetical protein
MLSPSIWVLIADEDKAAIWASEGGISHLLHIMGPDEKPLNGHAKCGTFARTLVHRLSQKTRDGRCRGLIVIAGSEMLKGLREAMVSAVSRLLIAEIQGSPETLAAIPRDPVTITRWGVVA